MGRSWPTRAVKPWRGARKERKKKAHTYSTTLIHEINRDSCTQVVEEQEIKTN
jgi:hypothetical protein